MAGERICLIRYDTESDDREGMESFFEKAVEVHRRHGIPATFFCRGGAIDGREEDFRTFAAEVAGDPLFDLQDHSYSHIGLGYSAGKPVEVLQEDYVRSFDAHERVTGKRPAGVSICGTSGADGPRLEGFDETEKGRAEFEMIVALGARMINTHLVGVPEVSEFTHYGKLGHPEVMGFPSGYSDTSWMHRRQHGDPVTYILGRIEEHAVRGEHMPVMLHDWVAWNHAGDRDLTHVIKIAEKARASDYQLRTHVECLEDAGLWT